MKSISENTKQPELIDLVDELETVEIKKTQSKKELEPVLSKENKILEKMGRETKKPKNNNLTFAPTPEEEFDYWRFQINIKYMDIRAVDRLGKNSPPNRFKWKNLSSLSSGLFYKKLYDFFNVGLDKRKMLRQAIYELEFFLYDIREELFPDTDWSKEGLIETTKTEQKTDYSIDDLLQMEDYDEEGGNIVNYCSLNKIDDEGDHIQRTIRFYIENGSKVTEVIAKNRYTEDTAPSEDCLQLFENHSLEEFNAEKMKPIYESLRKKFFDRIYHNDERVYDIFCCYAISTYFRECFDHFGFLDFCAPDPDFGKSTACECVTLACYNGLFQWKPTEAYIFRVIDKTKGVFGLDELDKFFFGKENQNMQGLILNSHKKGAGTGRINIETGELQPEKYDVFGAKLFTRLQFIDRQLESRSITINMVKNEGVNGKPIRKLRDDNDNETCQYERDHCYLFRIIDHQRVKETKEIVSEELYEDFSNRLRDIYIPPLTIARVLGLEEAFESIYSYALDQKKDRQSRRSVSDITTLLIVILENNLLGEIELFHIANRFNEKLTDMGELRRDTAGNIKKPKTNASIGRKLTSLRFRSRRKNKGMVYYIDLKKIRKLAPIYLRGLVDEGDNLCRKYPEIFEGITNLHFTYTEKDEKKAIEEHLKNEKKAGETLLPKERVGSVGSVGNSRVKENTHTHPLFEGSQEKYIDDLLRFYEQQNPNNYVFIGELVEAGRKEGLPQETIEKILKRKERDGEIFSPNKNYVKRV